MKKLKNNKTLLGVGITFLLLATISISYAWFSATVKNEDVKDQVVTTGTLELTYTDGTEIKLVNARPGASATKTITVKNTGSLDADYNLVWQVLKNEITNDEIVMSLTCQRLNENNKPEESCEGLDETPIKENIILKGRDIPSGYSHVYTVTVTFKETNTDQNYNQGKSFTGVLGVDEYKDTTPAAIYCTYDGDMTQGTEYTDGTYTYRYMQSYEFLLGWWNIQEDGWGVQLTDKTSTNAVTEAPCAYINNKPVTSYSNMFYNSKASSIDVSDFKTKKVTNMNRMFENVKATEIIGLENFNTSNVTNMSNMFHNSKLTSVNVSSFNTSKVTDMNFMFSNSEIKEITGLEKFNTSNVTNMNSLFSTSLLDTIDVSSFDTSKVTNMGSMFYNTTATIIKGIDNLNTSNATNMSGMFYATKLTSLELNNFDTSNVTDMSDMFSLSSLVSLDLSNFDTSNVTNMNSMFAYSENLKTIYASDKFVTTNVTDSDYMFSGLTSIVGGSGATYNKNWVNKNFACLPGTQILDIGCYFTLKTN